MGKEGKGIAASLLAIAMALSIAVIMTNTGTATDIPPGEVAIFYLEPKDSSVSHGNSHTVEVYLNTSVGARSGRIEIHTSNNACGNITGANWNRTHWTDGAANVFDGGNYTILGFSRLNDNPPGVYNMGNFTVQCVSSGECSCDLYFRPDIPYTYMANTSAGAFNIAEENGTFTCEGVPETFSKELPKGWNLISLPLRNTTDMTVANIMSSVSGLYDALYRYDAGNKSWVPMSQSDRMENGVGYFIHMTGAGTWSYNGTACTSMSIDLSHGLNMVGWVNTSASLPDTLDSIAGNYQYVARWNATAHKFEVYVPGAPPVFNDFDTMERGEGYFIAAKTSCTLAYP